MPFCYRMRPKTNQNHHFQEICPIFNILGHFPSIYDFFIGKMTSFLYFP